LPIDEFCQGNCLKESEPGYGCSAGGQGEPFNLTFNESSWGETLDPEGSTNIIKEQLPNSTNILKSVGRSWQLYFCRPRIESCFNLPSAKTAAPTIL